MVVNILVLCCVCVYLHVPSSPGGDLQASSGNLDEEDCDDVNWEEERESERVACEGDDFIPPKIMVHASFNHFDMSQMPIYELIARSSLHVAQLFDH